MILSGYLIGSVCHSEFGWPFTTTWVIFMIVASVLVAALNYRGIKVSARARARRRTGDPSMKEDEGFIEVPTTTVNAFLDLTDPGSGP